MASEQEMGPNGSAQPSEKRRSDHNSPDEHSKSTEAGDGKSDEKNENDNHIGFKDRLVPNKLVNEKKPAGGYDDTPIPQREPGYTIKITFHKATNLPLADLGTLSSDPYVLATLDTGLPTRHKEDPALQLRTQTIRRATDPVWDKEWIVANVPSSGFRLKCRIYDEDGTDHDDRLGNAHINVGNISENWEGIHEEAFKIKKRMGSKRAYLVRAMAVCMNRAEHMGGSLFVSVEVLGRTKDENGGRAYTVGPIWYTRHYSPLLGRITGSKEPGEKADGSDDDKGPERYNFQANQYQLHGPVPPELYHRYVEFKPWVKLMFTTSGIRGWLLSKALHHQHARVYNFDRTTEYGLLSYEPEKKCTKKFLDLVHWDEGGRIYTYVITVDGLFRFTETGKEFGIDMLSKHTMHSDVNIYIAFSGEFFIRRLKDKKKPPAPKAADEAEPQHPPDDIQGGPPKSEPVKDVEYYELVIDNDSGTYRPNADLLPKLKEFLAYNYPGLHILTLDCNKDAERQQRMKKEQRERKRLEGKHIIYHQASRSSSVSSSDVSDLDEMEAENRKAQKDSAAAGTKSGQMGDQAAVHEHGFLSTLGHDFAARGSLQKDHLQRIIKGRGDASQDPSGSATGPTSS